MTRKVKVICVVAVIAVLLISAIAYCSYYVYWTYHPRIVISRVIGFGGGEDDKNERIVVSYAERVPMNDKVKEDLYGLFDWAVQAENDLFFKYTAPYDIRVSGEKEDGKVTLRYEGYVTTQDGETIEYFNEKTFDIGKGILRDVDFFNNPPLSPLNIFDQYL